MRLYHYTCTDHGQPGIEADGVIRPRKHPLFPVHVPAVVWLTDLPVPQSEALGLTRRTLTCDRTTVRYAVDTDDYEPWPDFAERMGIPNRVRASLEAFGMPWHWFVSTAELPVAVD